MSVQVPKGYKQTELGVLPSNWTIDVLSSFWTVTDCKHVTAKFFDDGYPLASIAEVQSRYLDFSKCKKTNFNYYKKLIDGGRQPKTGDLVLSRNATVGEVAQVADWHPQFAMGQDVCLLRKKNNNFSTDYLQNIFRSFFIQKQLNDLMVGSTFKRANVQQIKGLIVPMPEPLEQKEIASALSDVEVLIESLEQLIAKKRQIKQGAMQELLTGQRRLPGFSGEWRVRHLGDIAEVVMGQSPSSVYYNRSGAGLPLIQGNADVKDRKTIKRVFTTQVSKYGFCGDILLSVRAPVGEVSIAVFDVCLGRGVCAIRYPNKFLYHALIAKEPVWKNISKGSTFDSVNSSDVKAFEIFMPLDEVEQKAIATLLNEMDTELSTLESRLDKARQIKQAMMQELLTGHIRLI